MENLFVTYEIAKIASDKGFDEGCIKMWIGGKQLILALDTDTGTRNSSLNKLEFDGISAPLYQQLVDWFSNKHNIEIQLKRDDDEYFTIEVKKYGECSFTDNVGYQLAFSTCESKDRYESYNIAFEEAFKLI